MREHLTGIEARDRGITELCEHIAPEGYRVLVPHEATALEDLGARLTERGPVDTDGTPLWIYGSSLPRELIERSSKVQVHEPYDTDDEIPGWFDRRFPQYIRDTSVPGYSCFSPGSLDAAVRRLLDEYVAVRVKDPNGASGVGQWTVRTAEDIEGTLASITADVRESRGTELADYLARYGYVVEAEVSDVEAWSVTLTSTPDGRYSSFGRLLELCVDTAEQGVIPNYGGTSVVIVRGDPDALSAVPAEGVVVHDPLRPDDEIRLAPSPEVVRAAGRFIEGMRLWETDGAFETRANVDVITGTLTRHDGTEEHIAAAVEESGRVGGASSAELLGIKDLRADPDLPHAVRSSRHGFDDDARVYAAHAATVPGSRVFWNDVDDGFDGKHVFIGAF